jgi:hypothetical protein
VTDHKTSRSVFEALEDRLRATFPDGRRSLPRSCTELLRQAVACHETGAFESAALTCRAAIEAASWNYLFIDWLRTGWGNRGIPRDRALRVEMTGLREIESRLFREEALPEELRPAFDRVRESGDSTAHLAEVTMRYAEMAAGEQVKRLSRGEPPDPGGYPDHFEPVWASREEAEALISDSASIIYAIFRASAQRSQTEHPEWFTENGG